MTVKKMRHIGVVVDDLDRTIKRFEGFGLYCSDVIENPESGIKIAFFSVGDTLIEFIRHGPAEVRDALQTIVRSQKGALNHLCFEVDNLEASIRDFEKNGARLVEGSLKAGAHGRLAFFHPETTEGILIELCEV